MKATFIVSNTDYKLCPKPTKPEYAFIGRSNVGKSSLINMITGHKGLAKTSQKPGKTNLINHFDIDDTWFLVDLPGYGYAKTSQTNREKWALMIKDYLINRGESLVCIFVLIDSRLPPQDIDLDFLEFLSENTLPFVMVFTKADKQSLPKTQSLMAAYKRKMLETWEEMPHNFISSAETKMGKEKILDYIEMLNKEYFEHVKIAP